MYTTKVVILEIVKYAVPALVVFATVYYILKQFMVNQSHMMALENRNKRTDQMVALKLKAYERLMMFCERISIPNLIYRLKANSMDARMLENALLIGIQQEMEHNLSQQIYVSDQLWQILQLAKDDVISYIVQQGSTMNPKSTGNDLSNALLSNLPGPKDNPISKAKHAVRTETGLLFA